MPRNTLLHSCHSKRLDLPCVKDLPNYVLGCVKVVARAAGAIK
jgi:hypothetical protein